MCLLRRNIKWWLETKLNSNLVKNSFKSFFKNVFVHASILSYKELLRS
uniref:Uncharacterized protein n=1 Tax=Anguilla anguilla TaxID=7936 RepID=A0A0E9WMM5_ANGAN